MKATTTHAQRSFRCLCLQPRVPRLWVCALLLALVGTGCGEEGVVEDDESCSSERVIRVAGLVAAIPGDYERSEDNDNLEPEEPVGELTDQRITIFLDEVEFTLPGGEPEMRPRIMTIQTNVAGPGSSSLMESLFVRRGSYGDEFHVVSLPEETYCDPSEGEICVRFGLDNTQNNELVSDTVIHEGLSGQIWLDELTQGRLTARFDVEFGPNLKNEFDDSSGHLDGCFDVRIGVAVSGATPLEVPGS